MEKPFRHMGAPGNARPAPARRTFLQRIHNPHNFECGCEPGCWCRRTAIGRAVRWWFPARWFGIHHKNSSFAGMTEDEIREWKRRQSLR